jgi:hypothetical protein
LTAANFESFCHLPLGNTPPWRVTTFDNRLAGHVCDLLTKGQDRTGAV